MDIFKKLANAGFKDLGFAVWEHGKGLQIKNLDLINANAPGVYVMHHNNLIQKVGKSSASLRKRLSGYRFFDKDRLACPDKGIDKTSQKQRKSVKDLSLPGLSVLAFEVEFHTRNIPELGIDVAVASFDPHDFEKKLLSLVRADHPLRFGG